MEHNLSSIIIVKQINWSLISKYRRLSNLIPNCFPVLYPWAAIRELAWKSARQLLRRWRRLRGDDRPWERQMERRSLQLQSALRLQEGNRYGKQKANRGGEKWEKVQRGARTYRESVGRISHEAADVQKDTKRNNRAAPSRFSVTFFKKRIAETFGTFLRSFIINSSIFKSSQLMSHWLPGKYI